MVVSDWYGIDQLWKKHFVAETEKEAAYQAFKAGVTIDLPNGSNYRHLVDLVKENRITADELDMNVSRILELKFKLGLFESGDIDPQKAIEVSSLPEADELALKAAEKSMVLLKNEGNLLPIGKNQYNTIAVIEPCANTNYYGDYSGIPKNAVTLLEGVKNKAGNQCEILYAEGCRITKNGSDTSMNNYQFIDEVVFPTKEENQRLIKEAVEVADRADFIIVAVGENEQLCREAWLPSHFGDNFTLDLLSDQEDLVKAIVATNKPVLVYLMHGRPLTINWIAENVPTIIDGWYMGQETGNAFAKILFGETSPSGKLTITYPRSAGQLPMYYNHKPGARYFEYVSGGTDPLFPFGHGLSYTTFDYSNLRLSDSLMKTSGSVELEFDITNTGTMEGDEIVQLYIRDLVSSVTRPVMELKDFQKITLQPGETKTVTFSIDQSKLAFWNIDMEYLVEPGKFEIMVGRSSVDYLKTNLVIIK
nr:glycoside hydrolase family 3 C-terminal domain-containing protein [Bacteroidota bacterium]